MRSYKNANGKLWVSCSECTRSKSCAKKKVNQQGCFFGELMEKYRDKI